MDNLSELRHRQSISLIGQLATHSKREYTARPFCYGLLILCALFVKPGYAITGINPSQHPPVDALPLPISHKINLAQAIEMILKTELGKSFEKDIAELAGQGKIRLTKMYQFHYGESGEGCTQKADNYVYEGYFIVLNEQQNIPELASSLVHETDHYRQIKRINQSKSTTPVSIGWLEQSAFATQLDFMQQLEGLGLAHRKGMFVHEEKNVFDIMTASVAARDHPSEATQKLANQKMLEFGYPAAELSRTLIVADEQHCQGKVN